MNFQHLLHSARSPRVRKHAFQRVNVHLVSFIRRKLNRHSCKTQEQYCDYKLNTLSLFICHIQVRKKFFTQTNFEICIL